MGDTRTSGQQDRRASCSLCSKEAEAQTTAECRGAGAYLEETYASVGELDMD